MEHRLSGILSKLIRPDLAKFPKIYSDSNSPTNWMGEMPAEKYHADKERMSSSAIRKILRSPRHFLAWWTGLEKESEEEEQEPGHYRFGRAAHMALLEPDKFRELHIIEPRFVGLTKDGRESEQSKEAKEKRKEWWENVPAGAVVLKEHEMEQLIGMLESVAEHKVARNMLVKGSPEVTIHWTDRETKVACKGRPDYIIQDEQGGVHIIDFKTTRDVRSGLFAQSIERLQYYTQLAFYHDGLIEVTGRQPSSLTIIAVEKEAPFECAVYPLEDYWYEKGKEEYQHALRIYKRCIKENKWPKFQQNASMLAAPNSLKYSTLPEFDFGDEQRSN